MRSWHFILICSFAVANCNTFHANQHLPLRNFQYQSPYQSYIPAYSQPSKTGYSNDPAQPGDFSDLMRQYQQWQIAIPNQQQGGVVWISAPVYGQAPPNAPGYPPAPPPYQPSPSVHPSPTDSTNQNTVVRDTIVPPANNDDNGTITLSPIETPEPTHSTEDSSTHSTTESTSSSPTSTEEHTSTTSTTTTKYTESTSPSPHENSTHSPHNSTNHLLKYCKEPRGQFPDPSDCHKFINCWDETAVEQSCPNGLAFNAEQKYCDYPENVNCTSSPSNSTSQNPPPTPPSEGNSTNSKCPSSYGTYRNTSNCAAFYVCVSGEPVDFICPPGTAYSDELKVCDYPYRVDCKGAPYNPAPTEEEPSTEKPSSSPSPSSPPSSSPPPTSTEPPSTSTSTPSTSSTTPSTTEAPSSTSISTEPSSTASSSIWTSEPTQTENIVPVPGVDPIALYNFNLKKLPESIVNTGVRCYHQNMYRLTPDCSSVTICQDGLTYIVNCGQATSFDAYSQRCVATFRARC